MNNIIKVDFSNPCIPVLDATTIKQRRKLKQSITFNAEEKPVELKACNEHTCEPIKDVSTLRSVSQYLVGKGRYRDNMIFILGINFGLRVSDLQQLRFAHILNQDLTFKESFPILEKKTENTRTKKKNRYVTINSAVMDAVELYLEHNPNCSINDYLFRSEGNRGKNSGKPLSPRSFENIIKNIKDELKLPEKLCTHSLRKTFGYHQMAMSNFSNEKLLLLQEMFGHSSVSITLKYIGITQDEILKECKKLNLGSNYDYSSVLNSEAISSTPAYA
jgi:integrase